MCSHKPPLWKLLTLPGKTGPATNAQQKHTSPVPADSAEHQQLYGPNDAAFAQPDNVFLQT